MLCGFLYIFQPTGGHRHLDRFNSDHFHPPPLCNFIVHHSFLVTMLLTMHQVILKHKKSHLYFYSMVSSWPTGLLLMTVLNAQ